MKFDHFSLRLPEMKDASQVLELILSNKARLIDYFPVSAGSITDIRSVKNYITEKIKQAKLKTAYAYLIIDDTTAKSIGFVFIKNIDWSVPKAELAYFIDKNYEGKGITSKALQKIIAHCFITLNMEKLFLRAAADNAASRKVALKNGFVQEGILRNDFRTFDGRLIDLYYYGLVKE